MTGGCGWSPAARSARITDEILTGPVRAYGYQSLAAYGLPAETALSAYRQRYPEAAPGDLLAAVQTDWWMRIPAIRLADAHAAANAGARHVHVRVRLGLAGPRRGPRRSKFPLSSTRPTTDAPLFGPLLGNDPPQELARTHARRLGFLRRHRGPWLAEV